VTPTTGPGRSASWWTSESANIPAEYWLVNGRSATLNTVPVSSPSPSLRTRTTPATVAAGSPFGRGGQLSRWRR